MKTLIAPSLLSANFLRLEDDIQMVNDSRADLFHIDVMDGKFVPNITFGFEIIRQIKKIAKKPLDVHLMIEDPDRHIEEFHNAGADYLSVHYETCPHLNRSIHFIKELGMKAGVVLNPHNPVEILSDIIKDVDFVLLMSVNPGYGGQKFIDQTFNRIQKLSNIISANNSKAKIEVDGGIDINNAKKLIDVGANILVAGSKIFGADNPKSVIDQLKSIN